MYYWICSMCGAYLDAGEKCDCKNLIKVRDNERKEKKKCLKKDLQKDRRIFISA